MKKIEIHCPFHGQTEEIQIPDGYYNFEGEMSLSRLLSPDLFSRW
jgi:hypothetical protein